MYVNFLSVFQIFLIKNLLLIITLILLFLIGIWLIKLFLSFLFYCFDIIHVNVFIVFIVGLFVWIFDFVLKYLIVFIKDVGFCLHMVGFVKGLFLINVILPGHFWEWFFNKCLFSHFDAVFMFFLHLVQVKVFWLTCSS